MSIALTVPLLTVGTFIASRFERDLGRKALLADVLGPEVLAAALLILMAVLVIAAVALAASTRLGQVMTLMTCVAVLIAGFLSDWILGQYQSESAVASLLYRIVPNINFFWVVDAVTAGIEIPDGYLLYTGAYAVFLVVGILCIGVALFQRREVG